jgi:phosphatidylglycerol---prolipoprotein diacylglyceryl transferase
MHLAHSLAGAFGLPYIAVPHLSLVGPLKIEPFGVLVALGVVLGARLLDKYAAWHRASEDDTRGLTWWLIISGFAGAHLFDVLAYQWDKMIEDPLLLIKVWAGISSYGGFIGGAIGYTLYVWWKRLSPTLWADIAAVGLLPAFSIGRIGCVIVHDHPGSPTTSALGFDYPLSFTQNLGFTTPMRLHNLALYELAYLILVNAVILGLAFRKSKRLPAGLVASLLGVLYAPVRFFLDYLRLDSTDPRYAGLTFAQWSSLVAFAVALYVTMRVLRSGKAALTTDDPMPEKKGAKLKVDPKVEAKLDEAIKRDSSAAERGAPSGDVAAAKADDTAAAK